MFRLAARWGPHPRRALDFSAGDMVLAFDAAAGRVTLSVIDTETTGRRFMLAAAVAVPGFAASVEDPGDIVVTATGPSIHKGGNSGCSIHCPKGTNSITCTGCGCSCWCASDDTPRCMCTNCQTQ